jgi:hypothetical protein
MAINWTAKAAASDQKMTLDELREFVQQCDRSEVPGSAKLEVRIKGLKYLSRIEIAQP